MATEVGSTKLQIYYAPKADTEDYTGFIINGKPCALFDRTIHGDKGLDYDLTGGTVVVIEPFTSDGNITFKADSLLIVEKLKSKSGSVQLIAKNALVSLVGTPYVGAKDSFATGNPSRIEQMAENDRQALIALFRQAAVEPDFDDEDSDSLAILPGLHSAFEWLNQDKVEVTPANICKFFSIPYEDELKDDLEERRAAIRKVRDEEHQQKLADWKKSTEESKRKFDEAYAKVEPLLRTDPNLKQNMAQNERQLEELKKSDKELNEEKKRLENELQTLADLKTTINELGRQYRASLDSGIPMDETDK
ncbi:MAG: hypothetical protein HYX67_01390 [Candidatus Melainabacteria bacterium]|nr:hypothetical protein [Candidatus Melainabacteria bacterium]